MAHSDRPHFDRSCAELRELAAVDRSGVLHELRHRSSRGAKRLRMELEGNGAAPAPKAPKRKAAKKPAKRKRAKRTPQAKAMPGTAPLGLKRQKHRRDAKGRILSKAASAALEAEEAAAVEREAEAEMAAEASIDRKSTRLNSSHSSVSRMPSSA